MFNLRIVQATYGDCLIVEYGIPSRPRYLLVDGGPDPVYQEYLRGELEAIAARGKKLDLAVVSHVDDDHIVGVLALLGGVKEPRSAAAAGPLLPRRMWHNTFSQTVGPEVERGLAQVMRGLAAPRGAMPLFAAAQRSIKQGDELTRLAHELFMPINPGFDPGRLVCVDNAPAPAAKWANLIVHVVGPTQKNLARLQKDWLAWLEKQAKRPRAPLTPRAAAKLDSSVPNLSSIVLLLEAQRKKLLLTGDARGDHVVQGLKQAQLLDSTGHLHVNVLKVPHHGSQRNVTRKFLQTVTADTYVISADGTNGNPDPETLQWIVEEAKATGRPIEIVATNRTDSMDALLEQFKPEEYGYTLRVMEPGKSALVLSLA